MMSTDDVSPLCFVNCDIAFLSRKLIRPALKSQFSPLCAESTPMTSNCLFGEDIHSTMMRMKQTGQVGKEATSQAMEEQLKIPEMKPAAMPAAQKSQMSSPSVLSITPGCPQDHNVVMQKHLVNRVVCLKLGRLNIRFLIGRKSLLIKRSAV